MKKIAFAFSLILLLSLFLVPVVQAAYESVSDVEHITLTGDAPADSPGPPPPEDDMWLEMLLTWVISGGGAGYLAFKLIDGIPKLKGLPPRHKRMAAISIAGGLAIAGYLFAVAMFYESAPVGWRSWVEQLVYIAGLGAVGSQVVHGLKRL